MVIAIPPALVIERDDEEVAVLQSFQHGFAVFLIRDGILPYPLHRFLSDWIIPPLSR